MAEAYVRVHRDLSLDVALLQPGGSGPGVKIKLDRLQAQQLAEALLVYSGAKHYGGNNRAYEIVLAEGLGRAPAKPKGWLDPWPI